MIRWIVNSIFSAYALYVAIKFIIMSNEAMIILMLPYILFQLLEIILLMTNKRPLAGASSWKEVVIPVVGAAWPIIISYVLQPKWVNGHPTLIKIGLVCLVFIYLLELIALVTIRYAFSVLPEARKIVKNGLYGYVRHPLYSLYIMWAGLNVVLTMNIRYFLFGMMPLIIFLYLRALMEEKKLLKYLDGYKEYKENTGMFFPRFNRFNRN